MVKARLVAIVFCLIASTTGWTQTSTPSLVATPPQPKWSELNVQQRIVLAPLADDWDSMEYYRQKKWLGITARFAAMSVAEQRRIQVQMQEWGKLTPAQRQLARENFKTTQQLSPEKKQELIQKWEEYSSLPEEEKDRLKQQAKAALAAQQVKSARPNLLGSTEQSMAPQSAIPPAFSPAPQSVPPTQRPPAPSAPQPSAQPAATEAATTPAETASKP